MALHPDSLASPNRTETSVLTWRVSLVVLGLTVLLCLPRFAHTTPDSVYYTNLVLYFRGELDRAALQAPFAFRWIAPWLVSWTPLSPGTGMAVCSVLSTLGAYALLLRSGVRLLPGRGAHVALGALLVCSFPTLNYGSAVLTDAAGFFVLAAASAALARERYVLLAVVLVIGTGVRETTLLMVPALWLYVLLLRPRRDLWRALAISMTTLAAAALHRAFFADLPPYLWVPSQQRFLANITRLESWITVTLTLAPLLTGLLLGHAGPPAPRKIQVFAIAVGVPSLALFIYATLAAYMSGRFCWPFYIALGPWVAWRLSHSRLSPALERISDWAEPPSTPQTGDEGHSKGVP